MYCDYECIAASGPPTPPMAQPMDDSFDDSAKDFGFKYVEATQAEKDNK